MTLRSIVEAHELCVCFGSGGVGKTTIAAALALAAARLGRRAAVLTIDPARALARAFGLEQLGPDPQPVGSALSLEAAMLDQKSAWDAFIRRHAKSAEQARAILENDFYQQLSTRFAGATEYVAVEQLYCLHESGRYDLIVLDTPAAAHALDFLRAPARVDRMLDPQVLSWLTGSGAFEHSRGAARMIVRRLERATGSQTLRSIASLLSAIGSLLDEIHVRSRAARALLGSERSAFVLVTSPRALELGGTAYLRGDLAALGISLSGVAFNRTHPVPEPLRMTNALAVEQLIGALPSGPARGWLERTLRDARATDAAEQALIRDFSDASSPKLLRVEIPELDHDLHSLADLYEVAELLTGAR